MFFCISLIYNFIRTFEEIVEGGVIWIKRDRKKFNMRNNRGEIAKVESMTNKIISDLLYNIKRGVDNA